MVQTEILLKIIAIPMAILLQMVLDMTATRLLIKLSTETISRAKDDDRMEEVDINLLNIGDGNTYSDTTYPQNENEHWR